MSYQCLAVDAVHPGPFCSIIRSFLECCDKCDVFLHISRENKFLVLTRWAGIVNAFGRLERDCLRLALARSLDASLLRTSPQMRSPAKGNHMEEFVGNGGQVSLRMLLDQSSDAVEIVDSETLSIVDVNEKACADLGYSREEMLSLRIPDIDPNVDDTSHATAGKRLKESESFVIESVHRRKDGSIFPVEVNIQRNLPGRYCIAIVRDITERKIAERAVQGDTSVEYADWQRHYRAALLETDQNELFKAVEVAESAVLTRLESLPSGTAESERHQLLEAWSALQVIKRRRLGFSE
jgi:PAS domain S-box-containing protein